MNTRQFFVRSIVFILPLVAFIVFPGWILYLGNEFTSLEERLQLLQSSTDNATLVGPSYLSEGNISFEMMSALRPDVLAIGDSRILQLRKEFFNDDVTFYNASDIGVGVEGLIWKNQLWDVLPEGYVPQVLIMNLGQNFFRKGFVNSESTSNIFTVSEEPHYLYIIRDIYLDYMRSKFTLKKLLAVGRAPNVIGIDALIHHTGRRPDGSFRQGYILENPDNPDLEDYKLRDTFQRIERGIRLFEHDTDISMQKVAELRSFLGEAARQGIHVIAFLPPYAPSAYEKMRNMGPEAYGYIQKIIPAVRPDFEAFGFSIFDFSDSRLLGASDEEFLDGAHGSERVYLRFLIIMAEHDAVLGSYVALPYLKEVLQHTKSDLEVF